MRFKAFALAVVLVLTAPNSYKNENNWNRKTSVFSQQHYGVLISLELSTFLVSSCLKTVLEVKKSSDKEIHWAFFPPCLFQVSGDVLQGLSSNSAACQSLHKSFLHDAWLRNARTAVLRWYCLHSKDPCIGQNWTGSSRVLHEANEWCSPWWLDNKNGLDLSHNKATCFELTWKQSKRELIARFVGTALFIPVSSKDWLHRNCTNHGQH